MPKTTITDCSVFNGHSMRQVPRLTFHGSPGTITSPATTSDVLIDGTGCTMVAGLIDAKIGLDANPHALLRNLPCGVTTVIDSSSTSSEAQAMLTFVSSNPTSPSYFASGSAIGPDRADMTSWFPYRGIRAVGTSDEAEHRTTNSGELYHHRHGPAWPE
jgi:hypothetical protein